MVTMFKNHPALKIVGSSFVMLPSPSSISFMWNFGSLLGLCLIVQIMTGLFLAMHFSAHTELSFDVVSHIVRDVEYGWVLRFAHANGASMFFISLYSHMGRGLWQASYKFPETWGLGVVMLLMVMASAFLGYVLPWGQMSFWGATVITNLFSAFPYIGDDVVTWLWGGFAVDNATLTRFFAFHFIVPILVGGLSGAHLLFLHVSGSSNPLGLTFHADKVPFHPYFTTKDVAYYFIFMLSLWSLVCMFPWTLGDPENFIAANPLSTPLHIQPEWYFLFAYAILRSIPNKLGGVVALLMSVSMFFVAPFLGISEKHSSKFFILKAVNLVGFFCSGLLLTWIGARPVESPYIFVGQILTLAYFTSFFSIWEVERAQINLFN